MIHLDTSFLIRALHSESAEDHKLRGWIDEGTTLTMSTVAWTEFLCGPLSASEVTLASTIVGQHREFTSEQAAAAARLFNQSGRRRGSLIDCMIAASALEDGAALATTNAGDFLRLQHSGLTIV